MIHKTETAGTNIGLLWIFGPLFALCLITLVFLIFHKKPKGN
ncbi:MAG: hypothetical protein ACYCX2_04820 [Christensenellales bacterium]